MELKTARVGNRIVVDGDVVTVAIEARP